MALSPKKNILLDCNGCSNKIKDRYYMTCSLCKGYYDLNCATMSETRFFMIQPEKKKAWKCKICTNTRNIRKNLNSPTSTHNKRDDYTNVTIRKPKVLRCISLENLSFNNETSDESFQDATLCSPILKIPENSRDTIHHLKSEMEELTNQLIKARQEINKLLQENTELKCSLEKFNKEKTNARSTNLSLKSKSQNKDAIGSVTTTNVSGPLESSCSPPISSNLQMISNTPRNKSIPKKKINSLPDSYRDCLVAPPDKKHDKAQNLSLGSTESAKLDVITSSSTKNSKTISPAKENQGQSQIKTKPKITIIGDQSCTNLASTLMRLRKKYVNAKDYDICSYTFPDAPSNYILENSENIADKASNDDWLVLALGSNDVQSPVLVVELTLNRLEGTQLRALGLLSVFGFNVTYAVRAPTDPPGPTSCSAIECRLLGHCYAKQDFHDFYCSCFEGYSGIDCGVGPLCPKTSNMCKNGGICRQMGPAAVSCICAPGYTGDLCESQIAPPECGIEECSEGCKDGTSCDCNPKDNDVSSARFETRLQVVDQQNINVSQEVVKQITSYLKASNITLEDEIEILNISSVESNGARVVWLRVWGARREAGSLRAALARLAATRSKADRLKLLPATLHFDMQPALSLHALIVNQRPEVWEGSEFILSCMAYGSPDIAFTWYKDGVKINFEGTTRDIWTRTVSEDALGRRMSVLGVSEAKSPDGGRWSCAADDGGRRRCRALRLAVLKPPDIRLVPSALTVNKGDNVSITCLAGAGRVHGALGFSWARERTLLPLAPGREVWEDLFPAGSVLKLYNVQKSGEFRCQVSSVAGTNAKGVTMWALGVNDVACDTEASHGLRWPKTAPGAYASASCPPGHNGETTRFCEPKTGQRGVNWLPPDFSGCVAESLKDIYEQFTKISYGYSWGNVSHVARQYGAVLRSLPSHPGEGTLPLFHSREMLHYLMSSAGQPKDRLASTEHLLKIYDTLLKHPDAFLDEEKIFELQNAVTDTGGLKVNLDQRFHEFTIKTKHVREEAAHFDLQATNMGLEEWTLASAGVELIAKTGNASVVAVLYHNLATRLPSLRRSIEFKNGREMEYMISSQQIQLSTRGPGVDSSLQHSVMLIFTHVKNYSAVASKLACGLRTPSEPRAWTTKACEVRVTEPTHIMCRCRGLGTFALFTIARSTLTDAEKDLRGIVKITASLGGAMCLAAAALQLLALVPGRKARLPVLLKVATAGTHSAAMLALLECDTRQEEACPGTLGWVCAACWCAGCAALCAQPLLLQAELAGRAQKAPSVGLLAGVCTLAWLTARLWGGAPLQLGAAAAAVCAGGCALLAMLCLALALCAALRLRTITHKVPAERRNYLKDRGRVVRHTLVLLFTTSAAQAAGVAYAQPGERQIVHVAALSAAALANGIAMIVCYVIRDEECLRSARRVLSMPSNKDWQDSPNGDTSLNLYIKQGGEVESRGGVGGLEPSSSPVSPMTSYWRAPGLESPARLHRRQSNPDCRADIVRCVEYKDSVLSPHRYERHLATTHAVCDLIPHTPIQPEYMARVCLELGVLKTPHTPPRESPASLLTCSVDFEPYNERHRFDTSKENCSICVQSNPDVSRIPSPPIKSCLKKSKLDYTSTSLPSIEVKDDKKSDIDQVNRQWNKAYDSPESDRMLNKISHDLDFLLNRTQENSKILDQIEEAPT